jgi:streptogramin lyase
MRLGLAVAVCGVAVLVGCGGSTSAPSGSSTTAPILPPVANAGGPYTGTAGTAVTFNGGGSTDPQGQALTYAWTFGDGATGTGMTTTHTYAQVAGASSSTYTVGLQVMNSSGYTGQASTTATIKGAAALPGAALTGVVASGRKGIVGAHVYLFAANATGSAGPGIVAGSGNASVSLENVTQTGTSDSVGAYVASGGSGVFSLTGVYTCTPGQQLYIYALGGNTGSGANPSAGLLAAIGSCPSATAPGIGVQVNEVSTVAAAYALAGYATDATHISSSGSALALTGMANAFANAANLVNLATGVALTATPAGNGVVPQAEIDSLANVLSACVDLSNPAGSCATLFSNSFSQGMTGIAPTDTATAAIYIAHNPGVNASSIYQVTANTPPYTPALSAQPNDFSIAISYSGGGLNAPIGLAIDAAGNAWVANSTGNSVSKFSSLGVAASGSPYTGGGLTSPYGVAIDSTGNAWVTNSGASSVTELSSTGSFSSGTSGYAVGGVNHPRGIAIDGAGSVWVTNYSSNSVAKLTSAGAAAAGSPFSGGGITSPSAIAIDGAGDAWIANYGSSSVSELSSAGAVVSGSPFPAADLQAQGIAVDGSGYVWVANTGNASVSRLSHAGALLSGTTGYTGGGLASPYGVSIDGGGVAWVDSQNPFVVSGITTTGGQVSGANGYPNSTLNLPEAIAIDGSGDGWVANNGNNTVTEFIGMAAPVVTPIAAGLPATPTANGTSNLGARP